MLALVLGERRRGEGKGESQASKHGHGQGASSSPIALSAQSVKLCHTHTQFLLSKKGKKKKKKKTHIGIWGVFVRLRSPGLPRASVAQSGSDRGTEDLLLIRARNKSLARPLLQLSPCFDTALQGLFLQN